MPYINRSDYTPPVWLKNSHLMSIYPTLFRRFSDELSYDRERLDLDDGDFLDLDWSVVQNSSKLAILTHGLEGSTRSMYIQGMVRELNRKGISALAWNFRGCSGEINRKLRTYHSCAIDDLEAVINHARQVYSVKDLYLIGYSLGGNQTLFYLGKYGKKVVNKISKAVVFSVPIELKSAAQEMRQRKNQIYMRKFMSSLAPKMRIKAEQFPGAVDLDGLEELKTFDEFDERYTGPLHGFEGAEHYWQVCSSKQYLTNIQVPTLLVNALDDPFLSSKCYPYDEAKSSNNFHFEDPQHGGHVGFIEFKFPELYWSERRTSYFLTQEK